jgi:hypothetical protein
LATGMAAPRRSDLAAHQPVTVREAIATVFAGRAASAGTRLSIL